MSKRTKATLIAIILGRFDGDEADAVRWIKGLGIVLEDDVAKLADLSFSDLEIALDQTL